MGPESAAGRTVATLIVCLLSLLGAACGGAAEAPGGQVRIVLITLDTLRHDVFEGGDPDRAGPSSMPLLGALARRGLIFDRHYTASSSTQPTHASLFTGLHPWEHGVVRNGVVLDGEAPTVAEILRGEGYQTSAAVASFPVTSLFGFERGFDRFDEEFDREQISEWNDREVQDGSFYRLANSVTDRALELVDSTPDGNQFFWFHYFDPHEPYGDTGPSKPVRLPELKQRFKRNGNGEPVALGRMWRLYREDVAFMDRHLARLINSLMGDERYQTHILVTADHGESIGEGRSVGHGKHLSDVEVHVPMLILSPGVAPARRSDPCGSVDVFVTLLGLAGLDGRPVDGALGGRDLLRESTGDAPVLGMRRTFEGPHEERLTDGSERILDAYRFYLLDDESMVRGNGERLDVDGAALTTGREREILSMFAALEQVVENLHSNEILDDETQEALKSLGYAR